MNALVLLLALTATPASPATRPAGDTGMTGILSEEGFKALHQLTSEKAPKPTGTMIDLAGTKAYLSLPPGAKAPLPAVIVIHEWWGLNDNIKHWSDRLAADGYAALAVDLYGGKVATTPDEAMAAMKAVKDDEAMKVLLAARDFLGKDERVKATKVASIGWCFGGGWSLSLARKAPDLTAAVIYYGRLTTEPEDLKPIHASLMGIFGNKDQSIPPETVNQFDEALAKAGVKHQIFRYDAEHAFANPSNPHYDETSAAAAWSHVRPFLAEQLKK